MYFTDAGYSDTHFNTAKLRNKAQALAWGTVEHD